jgi:hypothetical protein
VSKPATWFNRPLRASDRRRPSSSRCAVLAAAAVLGGTAPAVAQVGAPADTVAPVGFDAHPVAAGAECRHGRISEVWIDNHSVFDLTDPNRSPRFDWAFRLANRLHIRTREDVIRRELVFDVGDCYEPPLLRESERVLRASNFIAEVDIFGVEQPDGSYHVIVDTRDEWSTRVEPRTGPGTGLQLTGISIREDNLLGTGRQASAFYLEDQATRIYGISYHDPQLFATRWQAGFAVGRTPLGGFFRESVVYPFVGETGRFAFRHHIEHHDRYFGFIVREEGRLAEVLMPERRRSFDVGGAVRFGPRGRLTLLGAMLTGEWMSYPAPPRASDPSRPGADSLLLPFVAGFDSVADVRAVALLGQRNVRFIRQRALDTVHGVEDVRLGVEVELGLGSSLGGLSAGKDLSIDLGAFLAGEIAGGLIGGTRLVVEGRRNYEAPADEPEWDDVFGQFDAWTYWRRTPESRHTWVATLAASGGWNSRIPFQLTLGGATGLRGQPFHLAAGARRAVVSLEGRSYWGWPHPELFDLGSSVFVDVGRLWAGSVPFGVDTGLHANVGVGLRAAFPPGSQNTYRIDVAAPVGGGIGFSDLVFSVGVGQTVGRSPRHDPELFRTSRRGPATSLFGVRTDRER